MSIKVFLADDHAVVRDGLKMLLDNQSDLNVVGAAPDGREAVRQIGELQPDVVVMDVTMLELNGIEATHQIQHRWPHTRVIILSMHNQTEYVMRALQAGACGYLLKEAAGDEVANAVRTVAAGNRYLSPKISNLVIDIVIWTGVTAVYPPTVSHKPPTTPSLKTKVTNGQPLSGEPPF